MNHRTEKIAYYVSAGRYVQHNPSVPDSIGAFQEFMAGPGKEMVYRDVFKIIGQGNFVMAYSHVFLGERVRPYSICSVSRTAGSLNTGTTWSRSPRVLSPTAASSS